MFSSEPLTVLVYRWCSIGANRCLVTTNNGTKIMYTKIYFLCINILLKIFLLIPSRSLAIDAIFIPAKFRVILQYFTGRHIFSIMSNVYATFYLVSNNVNVFFCCCCFCQDKIIIFAFYITAITTKTAKPLFLTD